jgi:hypothetical protein
MKRNRIEGISVLPLELENLKFLGRHRCPRCRMPLRAEELSCPACELQIVFVSADGEIMVEMVSMNDPADPANYLVGEYRTALALEEKGDMYIGTHLPTAAHRADLVQLPDGWRGIRFSNRVSINDIAKPRR